MPLPSEDCLSSLLQKTLEYARHPRCQSTDFNLMGLGHLAGQRQGPVQRWEDNRIGFTEDRVWRYDPCGNRIAQMHADHSQQQLHYDGAHQLIAVRNSQIQGNAEQLRHHSRYTYDALGRRLKQQVESADSTESTRTHYYGWDGDRLIHTERLQHGSDTRHIEHTIYEPGSFTPLVRLSTTASGDPQDQPHLLVQAITAGLPDPDDPNHAPALALMQTMLDAMPRDMQQDAARHLRHTLDHGLPPGAQAMLGEQADSTTRLLSGMQAKLQEQEKEQQARIAIHHYHCDHLGTPMALTDQRGLVTWAAKLDPWGNVLQEYNPQGIHQAIRLPGQHHDRETGLYYNRHRYYDPVVGSYINQDPIGLMGGFNVFSYGANDPIRSYDPLGLDWVRSDITYPRDSPDPENPLNFNTVYCDNEEVKINSNNVGKCQNALGTTVAHENSHKEDILNSNKDICKGNKGISQIGTSNKQVRLASERKAHELEIAILENALKDPPVGCTSYGIEAEIRTTKKELLKVHHGTYPN